MNVELGGPVAATAVDIEPATGRWVKDGDDWLAAVAPQSAREGERVQMVRRDGSEREMVIVAVTVREHRGDRLCRVA